MKFKKPTLPFLFKRLNRKSAGAGAGGDAGCSPGGSGTWRFKGSSPGLRWKGRLTLYTWFIDGFLFKIVYVLEAVVLVITLCFFYLLCGCHL